MIEKEKIYFIPGDVVTLKKKNIIPNSPVMIVVKKQTKYVRTENVKADLFQGIICRWFTTSGELQEAVFNTKDLIHVTQ